MKFSKSVKRVNGVTIATLNLEWVEPYKSNRIFPFVYSELDLAFYIALDNWNNYSYYNKPLIKPVIRDNQEGRHFMRAMFPNRDIDNITYTNSSIEGIKIVGDYNE